MKPELFTARMMAEACPVCKRAFLPGDTFVWDYNLQNNVFVRRKTHEKCKEAKPKKAKAWKVIKG